MINQIYQIKKIIQNNGFEISDSQVLKLEKYVELLLSKNKSINLISRKDEENIWENHIFHSLSLLFYFKFFESAKVLDLGTGGGLPGIPLKILYPRIKIDLVDSIQKKIIAVNEFINELELIDTRAICSRAENLNKSNFGKYDIIVSRAVAPLKDLIKWSIPLLKKYDNKSTFNKDKNKIELKFPTILGMKGGDLTDEIHNLKVRFKLKKIEIVNINIKGIDAKYLQDKKIVMVIL